MRLLLILLARYCANDLNQFENWKLDVPYSPVYVRITRELPPGVTDESFHTVWPLPPHLEDAGDPDDGVHAKRYLGELRVWLATSLRMVRREPDPSGVDVLSFPDDADIIAEVRRLRALADQVE